MGGYTGKVFGVRVYIGRSRKRVAQQPSGVDAQNWFVTCLPFRCVAVCVTQVNHGDDSRRRRDINVDLKQRRNASCLPPHRAELRRENDPVD